MNKNQSVIVNDVTGLNPVSVWAISVPTSVSEVQDAVRRANGPISIGGGRFSMGGQVASNGSLHVDMRGMNRILRFEPEEKTVVVEAGVRWCDVQRFVDPHGLAVKSMQTYANFTVGGSLSVNCHGRYVGLGPVILSVVSISVVMANGDIQEASPASNSELFFGVIGGYGGLGIIVRVKLKLADNTRVERISHTMPLADYLTHFKENVRHSSKAVFHNADIYPPHYKRVRSVTWYNTDKPETEPRRLQASKRAFLLEAYVMWMITELPFGKWRREWIIDPLLYLSKKVHWRNFEAGYDVAELEPPSRAKRNYVLQEYFIPVERLYEFAPKMANILQRFRVNVINVSIRHASPDPGSTLAWAREEVFAFVLYYKQRLRANAKQRVAVWTRELIDAAIESGGTYYLPYQAHATSEQFHKGFPKAKDMFSLKRLLDPEYRLRNVLWDQYYAPTLTGSVDQKSSKSEFIRVYQNTKWRDDFYRFLQTVFHLQPEDRFHTLILEACERHENDETIYRTIQETLPGIKPWHADLSYALPALGVQKREMTTQTLELLKGRSTIDGYVEIGAPGRYLSKLRKHIKVTGPVFLIDEKEPGYAPPDLMERGRIRKFGSFIALDNYKPIEKDRIDDESVDLVSCFIGLHHIDPKKLDEYVASIVRILRPGGVFILRDHDVPTPEMDSFVSLVHTVFNAGTGVSWEENAAEPRYFAPLSHWIEALAKQGLKDTGQRLLQAHDPSDNTLMSFKKGSSS